MIVSLCVSRWLAGLLPAGSESLVEQSLWVLHELCSETQSAFPTLTLLRHDPYLEVRAPNPDDSNMSRVPRQAPSQLERRQALAFAVEQEVSVFRS